MPDPNILPDRFEDLLEIEQRALEAEGRVLPDGRILARAPEKVAEAAPALPAPELLQQVMPANVAARLEKIKEVESSFIHRTADGKVKTSSDDGRAAAAVHQDNPDFITKPAEPIVEFEDKAKFLAHILGAPHFEKTYSLCGGIVEVTFHTISQYELEQCQRQAWADDQIDGTMGKPGSEENLMTRMARYMTYRFVGELYSIKRPGEVTQVFKPFETKSELLIGEGPIRAATEVLKKTTSSPFLQALMEAHNKFSKLVSHLSSQADRADFWRAVSGT
jgi:hypothetical protein